MTDSTRETFTSRFGVWMTMLGVAVGLGNVWRFPYLVGKFGGSAFVLFYVVLVVLLGVPALMAEWALGRHTRRGTLGAFALTRIPFGKQIGWFLFVVVIAATGYYTNVIGWVALYGIAHLARMLGFPFDPSGILPPETGFSARSLALQLISTAAVIVVCAIVLIKGLRRGIERVSIVLMPALFVVLMLLIVRSLTLPGAQAGIDWYILKFRPEDFTARVAVAALGHTMFTLSLGGTFMVVYGSYLNERDSLRSAAIWTAFGDTVSGLLAGLAIFPAVFALGLAPASGPGLIFATLPKVFAQMPAGGFFGFLFFLGLFGAGYLSDVASFEVVVAGFTDNTKLSRTRAVWITAALVFVAAIPPMINMRIFIPWDLTFGSGMQTLGALLAVVTVAWSLDRSIALRELSDADPTPPRWMPWLYVWLRYVVPGAIVFVGVWWLVTDVLGLTTAV